ncbi:MAG: hypothetical protein KGL13_09070 [Gammaproteobacteria bacterium]|nr:hypothetical protein [Gammaproteobacteria bacterium]MDE2346605.1 hypothetical protein [Gammaproteobacteria bacterium]
MNKQLRGYSPLLLWLMLATGCGMFSNPATRLANRIEMGAEALGVKDGSAYMLMNLSPSGSGECRGPYSVRLDPAGTLTVVCKNASGQVTSSVSTTAYARMLLTPHSYMVNKAAGSDLSINLQRQHGRAVIVGVQ